jgi:hypothetical protein
MPPRRKASGSDGDVVLNIPPPATTIEGRNNQLIAHAFDLAERRLLEGTASAQEVVHFLRLGAAEQRLKEEKLKNENLVLAARTEEMKQRTSGEELMNKALQAFRGYSGQDPVDPEAEEWDEDVH